MRSFSDPPAGQTGGINKVGGSMKEKVLDWLLGFGLASVMLLATAL
jgi:hypothetical protein